MSTENSNIEGTGFFAPKAFKKGEVVANFSGKSLTLDEAEKIFATGCDYMLQVNHETFLFLEDDTKYFNHSCEPNAAFLFKSGELVALREIREGEEITFDYSANENTNFSMKCLCGTDSCRGTIVPFSKLARSERIKLQPLLTPYLRGKAK